MGGTRVSKEVLAPSGLQVGFMTLLVLGTVLRGKPYNLELPAIMPSVLAVRLFPYLVTIFLI